MADNVTLPGEGSQIATDEVAGRHLQIIKVAFGADGAATLVDSGAGLPNGSNNMPLGGGGIGFATGIGRSIVTGSADADATATTAGAVVGDLFYA